MAGWTSLQVNLERNQLYQKTLVSKWGSIRYTKDIGLI